MSMPATPLEALADQLKAFYDTGNDFTDEFAPAVLELLEIHDCQSALLSILDSQRSSRSQPQQPEISPFPIDWLQHRTLLRSAIRRFQTLANYRPPASPTDNPLDLPHQSPNQPAIRIGDS